MKLTKSSYGALTFAILLFLNPNFNAFDFFPDFIGAFIIAAVLSRATEVVPFFAEARDGFIKVGILSAIRLPSAIIMYTNLFTGMDIVPLFTFVFGVIELILLYPAVMNLYRGLTYLGERSCAVGIVRPIRVGHLKFGIDGARDLTLIFLTIRAVCNILPQFCHLTYSDERMTYIMRRIYSKIEISMLLFTLLIGIIWAGLLIRILFAVKKRGGVAEGIIEMAGEERLAEISKRATAKSHVRALGLLFICAIFNLDIALESTGGFNVLPRFIFAFIFLYAVLGFVRNRAIRVVMMLSTLSFSVVSLIGLFTAQAFEDKFGSGSLAIDTMAQLNYKKVELLAVVELLFFAIFVIILSAVLVYAVKKHTGLSPDDIKYSRTSAAHHRVLCKKVIGFSIWLLITGVMKCVNVILIGSPVRMETQNGGIVYGARLPWFGTATFVVSLILVFYAYYLSSTLRDEVRLKYDIPKKGEI